MTAPTQLDIATPPSSAIHGVRLSFWSSVSMTAVADTLELARLAAECLHGPERLALDGRWEQDARTVAIDTTSEVGRTLAIVFLGFVKREFGDKAVRIVRMGKVGSGVAQ